MTGCLSRLNMFLLLICWIITGIMAEDSTFIHYGLKHSSVCLHVQKNPPYTRGQWKFGKTFIASDAEMNPTYTAKVVYRGNGSLCINELTDRNAGTYEFSFFSNWTELTETHMVIVEEKVPEPVIRMSGLQFNLSAGLCNFTVNCSVQHEWLSSVCEADGCRTSQRSFSKVNITISTNNRSVVCRGNNHVSTNNVTGNIDVCFSKSDPEPEEEPQHHNVIIILIALCVFLCGCVVFVVKCCSPRTCYKKEHTAQIIQSQPIETQPRAQPRASTSSSHSEASYENVDILQEPSQTSSPRQELGSVQSQKVDTVYSILQRPKDTKGNENIQVAVPSQSVTPVETQHPVQVETVYSMLKKPKRGQSTT
ncbi:uncharacterized protein LOC114450888 [Parambassis ranga]|uniref:Uncharacterized protein LOC114450888 n=1 Tax=Parambassis ranga TaxID=210632 RepID=A0A6P7K9C3_9TELE|nr:uncharacterized protein LOC114450888 [Parambassis ranga]